MPIVKNNKHVERIKFQDKDIYRVFKGKELVWGLFKIKYNNMNNLQQLSPSEYVWGKTYKLPTISPTEGTFKGWYSDKNLTTAIESIDKNKKEDLTLYSKVVKQKTQYNISYKWDAGYWNEWDEDTDGGDGGFWRRTSQPSSSDVGFTKRGYGDGVSSCILGNSSVGRPWTGSTLPNCVGYVWGRWYEMGQNPDAYGLANAGAYVANHNDLSDSPNLGAVLVWDGHVAIVESIDGSTITWTESNWSGPIWRQRSSSTPWTYTGNWRGYLRFPGGGGGGGTVHHKEWVSVWQTGSTGWQDSPSCPSGKTETSRQERIVYSYYNYNTNSWTDWSTIQP